MSDDSILYERRDAVAVITFNRPDKLNAFDLSMLTELDTAVRAAGQDPEVRVIVFTGAGEKAFVAGGDISDLESRRGLDHYLEFAEKIHGVLRRIETVDKPTIGAINGWALGGGAELLLCLDIRLVAEKAKIGVPEITLGLFPGAGGSQRLIRQVSLCKAKEMMYIGQPISARDALDIGLINRVCPGAELMAATMDVANSIASKSPLTLKFLKRAIGDGLDMPLPASLRHEQAMIGLVQDSHDAHEGCKAFLEKRDAKFEGR
jgi:enoyl-CoA hydratase